MGSRRFLRKSPAAQRYIAQCRQTPQLFAFVGNADGGADLRGGSLKPMCSNSAGCRGFTKKRHRQGVSVEPPRMGSRRFLRKSPAAQRYIAQCRQTPQLFAFVGNATRCRPTRCRPTRRKPQANVHQFDVMLGVYEKTSPAGSRCRAPTDGFTAFFEEITGSAAVYCTI